MPLTHGIVTKRRNLTATTQECWEKYWTSLGDNTPRDAKCTATYLPSRKLYRSEEPDMPDTAGEAKTSSLVTYYYGPPHMAKQKQVDQPELTYSSYVRTQDVTQKTCRRWWTIGKSGERWSRISVLAARLDDDEAKFSVLGMTLNCMQRWGSNSRTLFSGVSLHCHHSQVHSGLEE